MPSKTKTTPGKYIEHMVNDRTMSQSPSQSYSQRWDLDADWTDSTTGYGNPFWKEKLSKGKDATTVRNGVKSRYTSYGSMRSNFAYNGESDGLLYTDGVETFKGFPMPPAVPVPTLMSYDNVTRLASLSFLKDIKNAVQTVSSGSILGELKRTIHDIKRPANGIYKLLWNAAPVHSYRKTKQGWKLQEKIFEDPGSQDVLKAIAETRLEIEFGLKPLLADSRDIAVAIAKIVGRRDKQSVKGYAEESQVFTNENSSYYCNSSLLNATISEKRQEKVSCRFKGSVDLATSWEGSIADNFGIMPNDIVPSLWEIAPWSFLVDYFVDVSGWLNAAMAATSRLTWTCGTRRSETTVTKWAKPGSLSDMVMSTHGSGFSSASTVVFDRGFVGPEVPVMPKIRLPGINQTWNILALWNANREFAKYFR